MVKSNSLRATKSSSSQACSEPAASTATFAPIMPIFRFGLAAFSARTVFTSEANDGVEVCSTTRSRSFASGSTSASDSRCGGASISLEPSTIAAGCASQVGYQNDLISRRF